MGRTTIGYSVVDSGAEDGTLNRFCKPAFYDDELDRHREIMQRLTSIFPREHIGSMVERITI